VESPVEFLAGGPMQKFLISAVLALVMGGVVVAAVVLGKGSAGTSKANGQLAADMAAEMTTLREEVERAAEESRAVAERVGRLETALDAIAREGGAAVVPASARAEVPPPPPGVASDPEKLRAYVLATIEEDRKAREEDRKKEREAMRKRVEEGRKEMEALGQGPYDRYNLKINSLAKVLGLDDAQKQAYFELSKAETEKLRQAREAIAAEARAKAEASGEAGKDQGGRGRGSREVWGKVREASAEIEKEFAASVQGMLSPAQIEAYGQLSEQARSFQNLGYVGAPGEDLGFLGRLAGGGARGGAGNPGNNAGNRGQQGQKAAQRGNRRGG
jgi:hypothetical protein